MALNKFMHPRNPYKDRKPNFKELANKYDQFKEHASKDAQGGYHIDFKKPECLRALSWVLLKENFDLDVVMPLDRLIPTIPLRLNYILWLEDILGDKEDIIGIDIGTGSCCVYPLVGAKKNAWRFLATEADSTNFGYAQKNVTTNSLEDRITVMKVEEAAIVYDVISDDDKKYDFCMCNPPFFGSNLEAWGMLTSRSDDRPEPSSVCTASPVESIVAGGEVQFIKRMISDSLMLKDRIRVYTTMLGKKSSLVVLKEELKHSGISNFSQTEFCQGKTMRWGLGWSFDDTVEFPKPPSKIMKSDKSKPVIYQVPHQVEPLSDIEYSLDGISNKVTEFLNQLEVLHNTTKNTNDERCFKIVAVCNTWSNQRRKRRQDKRERVSSGTEHCPNQQPVAEMDSGIDIQPAFDVGSEQGLDDSGANSQGKTADETVDQCNSAKKPKLNDDGQSLAECGDFPKEAPRLVPQESSLHSKSPDDSKNITTKPADPDNVKEYLFKGSLSVKKCVSGDISLELQWIEGQNKEHIHQVMQYFKNNLK